ncbi:MAG: thioredoxin family protein [Candidatus Rifleibacteriota bacterium]
MKKILTVIFLFAFLTASFAQTASTTPETTKKLPRLVDFGSKQCRACKAMEPVLETCKEKYSDKFITEFVDVWQPENQAFAQANNIQSIPTQVFFSEENKELFRHTGFISEEDILAKWSELGFPFAAAKPEEAQPDSAATEAEQPNTDDKE